MLDGCDRPAAIAGLVDGRGHDNSLGSPTGRWAGSRSKSDVLRANGSNVLSSSLNSISIHPGRATSATRSYLARPELANLAPPIDNFDGGAERSDTDRKSELVIPMRPIGRRTSIQSGCMRTKARLPAPRRNCSWSDELTWRSRFTSLPQAYAVTADAHWWRGGRVAEGGGLLNRYRVKPLS